MDTTTTAAAADSDVQTSTALVPVEQRAALALNSSKTEEHLKELASKHRDIVLIKDKAGREQAHGAAMELQKARTTIEKVAKTARDDATKFSKAVIAEEKRLIGIIEQEEDRLFKVRDVWDAEQERIKAEKVAAEQQRVDRINAAIAGITAIATNLVNATSDTISVAIAELESLSIVDQFYEEFTEKAIYTRSETLQTLTSLYAAASEREAEAKRMVEEQARLAEERAKLDAERAELDRQRKQQEEAAARAAAEAAAAAQKALDEANAKSRREAEERAVYLKQQEDAFAVEKAEAEAKLKADQEKVAAELAAITKANAERAAQEAAAKAAKEVEEANARLKAQEEAKALRLAEVRERTDAIVDAIANQFQVDHSTAVEFLLEAADYLREEVTA